MYVQLAENVTPEQTLSSEPQGVIRICCIEARNLLKKDVRVTFYKVYIVCLSICFYPFSVLCCINIFK